MRRQTIIEVIRSILVLVFIYAAATKLLSYSSFLAQLYISSFIRVIAPVIATMLPLAEIAIAALLTVNRTRILGMYSAAAILLLFTGYITGMLIFRQELPCTCGGMISRLTWPQHIIFNLVLLSLAGVAIRLEKKNTVHYATCNA